MSDDLRPAPETLEQLRDTLEVALSLVRTFSDDALLGRLISAFRSMPSADRPVIIGVLEREVTGRLLGRATEKSIGQSTRPNPNARLYIRAHEPTVDAHALGRDDMMVADIRAMRIACLIRNIPELYANWKAALRAAMDHVDEPIRAVAEELLHDVLGCIAEARKADAAAGLSDAAGAPPHGDEGAGGEG
jgi:hypothetical protein